MEEGRTMKVKYTRYSNVHTIPEKNERLHKPRERDHEGGN